MRYWIKKISLLFCWRIQSKEEKIKNAGVTRKPWIQGTALQGHNKQTLNICILQEREKDFDHFTLNCMILSIMYRTGYVLTTNKI